MHGSEIDPLFFEKGYYVEPEEVGRKPFALLVRALTERKLLAVGKLAIRTKERLCALRPHDGSLVLETLFYADEVRTPEAAPPAIAVSEAEMKIANALIDLLEEPVEFPTKYTDEYRVAMMAVITRPSWKARYSWPRRGARSRCASGRPHGRVARERRSGAGPQGGGGGGAGPEAAASNTNGRAKKAAKPEPEEPEAEPAAAKGSSRRKKTSTPA